MGAARTAGATVGGVIAGAVTISIIEAIGHAMPGATAPFAAAAVALGLAGLAGAAAATRLAGQGRLPAILVVVTLLALSMVNISKFPHPGWFAPVAFPLLIAGSWFGWRLARRTAS